MSKLRVAPAGESAPTLAPSAAAATWRLEDGSVFAQCDRSGDALRVSLPGVGVFVAEGPTAVVAGYPDPAVTRERFLEAFRDEAAPLFHAGFGAISLHASAVAQGNRAVAILGASHAGKSTLAYAWATGRGRAQLADDALVLDERAGRYLVHPIAFEPKLRSPMRAALEVEPGPAASVSDDVELAALVVLSAAHGRDARPRLTKPAAHGGFRLVVAQAYCFTLSTMGARRDFFGAYLRLLRSVPMYELAYPHTIDRLDATIDLLDGLLLESLRDLDDAGAE